MVKFFKKPKLVAICLGIALTLTGITTVVVQAATWAFQFPIVIQDTSNTTRAYYPVILTPGGTSLAAYTATGMDTNMQEGVMSRNYMMDTANITTVVNSLPSGGKVNLSFYTGYSPAQTSFPIIMGDGGSIGTPDNAALEPAANWSDSFGVLLSKTGSVFSKSSAYSVTYNATFQTVTTTINNGISSPTVASSATGTVSPASNSWTVNMPAGVTAGDLLVVLLGHQAATPTFPAGWAQFFTVTNTVVQDGWYKYSTGTEGASITVSMTGVVNGGYVSYRLTGASGVPEATTNTGSSGTADPPNIVPSWGSMPNLYLATESHVFTDAPTSSPAGYVNILTGGENGVVLGITSGQKAATSGSENPGIYGYAAPYTWVAVTVAIKPYLPTSTISGVAVGFYNFTATSDGVNFWTSVGANTSSNQTTASIIDNASGYVWGSSAVAYFTDIKHYVGGTLKLEYSPNAMVVGTNMPDLTGNSFNGTITFGTNQNVSISYGALISSATTSASGSLTAPNTGINVAIPSRWWGAYGLSAAQADASFQNSPFYGVIHDQYIKGGYPTLTVYATIFIGLAVVIFLLVAAKTRSIMAAVAGMILVLYAGAQTGTAGAVPLWLPTFGLVIELAMMIAYRQLV